jgi:hypothetical protein
LRAACARSGAAFSETAERKASRISGGLPRSPFTSCRVGLVDAGRQAFSAFGLAITIATIPIMYPLAPRKLTIAEKIGSRALRADAMESITCGWLSFVVPSGSRHSPRSARGGSIPDLARDPLFPRQGRMRRVARACGCCSCD